MSATIPHGGPARCPTGPCSECSPGPHHFGDMYIGFPEEQPDHPAAKLDLPTWWTCKHCDAWVSGDVDLEDLDVEKLFAEGPKHSPGPWRARRTALAFAITSGPPGRNGFAVVTVVDAQDNPEAEHDANLIAAAPEAMGAVGKMSNALALAFSLIGEFETQLLGTPGLRARYNEFLAAGEEAIAAGRAASAKSEGRE